jgi:hypothetical protein
MPTLSGTGSAAATGSLLTSDKSSAATAQPRASRTRRGTVSIVSLLGISLVARGVEFRKG